MAFTTIIILLTSFNFISITLFLIAVSFICFKDIDLLAQQPKEEKDIDLNTNYPLDIKKNKFMFCMNIAKNIFGTSIIYIPWIYSVTGWGLGNALMAFTYVKSAFLFVLIGKLAKITEGKNYSDLFSKQSKVLKFFVDVCILLSSISINTSYVVFIVSRLRGLSENTIFDLGQIGMSTFVSLVVLWPFCLCTTLKGYRCASVFAMIGFLAVLASSFYLVVTVDHSTITTSIFPRKWLEIPSVVPVVMGNFNGHTNAATFYNEYESSTEFPTIKKYGKLVFVSFGIVYGTCFIFGNLVYFSIGDIAEPDIAANIENQWVMILISLVMIFSTSVTYFMYVFTIRTTFQMFDINFCNNGNNKLLTFTKFHFFTIITIIIAMCPAYTTADIGLLTSMTLALFGTPIVVLFPVGLFMWKIKKKEIEEYNFDKAWKRVCVYVFYGAIFVFGFVVEFGMGFGTSFAAQLKKFGQK